MSSPETATIESEVENGENTIEQQPLLYSVTSQTPWWIVSILLHGLVISLACLLSMVIEIPETEYAVQVTEFVRPATQVAEAPKSPQGEEPLVPHCPIDPSNGTAQGEVNMLIPIDVLEKAIVGDMFKTPTERQFEQEGAFGDPRSQIFYAAVAGEPGGGGTGASEFADMSVGVGGGSPGSDGGWGGGKGGGIGAGEGSGKASWGFANRGSKELMIRRNNPGKQWKPILDQTNLALRWLAYHQEGDGRWDAVKYGSSVKTDTAVTGLALLALLGAGHTEKVGEYAGNVRKAVAWLKSKQAADGCIWDTTDDGAGHRRVGYPNAIATLAIAEAAGMANIPDTREAAKKAIEYACNIHQSGEGYDKLGWRYGPKSEGDLSVTGWYIMALKSAKVSGLPVPAASIDGAIKFLDSVEKRDNDASGYSASQYKYMAGNEHAHTAHRLTAIGTLSRQYLGWKKDELQGSVDWFVNKGGVPNAGANGEGTDLYYWYYGSLCVFQQGGDLWKRWNEGMLKSLLPTQCKHGDDQGSWNPVGDYSSEWGRVGQTALSVLCLEVYYRYDQLKNMK